MVNHIVCLEDDLHLYNILKTALHSVNPGLKLVQFANGEHLLRYLVQPSTPIDLIVLDIRVQGRYTGLQVAQELRRIDYPARMVLTSAYVTPDNRLLSELKVDFIPKPWKLPQLIRQLLDLEPIEPIKIIESRRVTGTLSLPNVELPLVMPFTLSDKFIPRLRQVLHFMLKILKVSQASFLVVEPSSSTIETCVSTDEHWETPPESQYLKEIAGTVLNEKRVTFVPDVYLALPSNPIASRVASFAAMRIELPNERQGVLVITNQIPRNWNKGDYEPMQFVAQFITDMVETDQQITTLSDHNNELNSYSSTIAHDLKTPLATIIAYADVIKLLMIDSLPPQIDHYLTGIIDSSRAMSDMITRLLWLARLENPLKAVAKVKIMPVVHAALSRLQYHIKENNVTIDLPMDFPPVIGHDVWIEEVFANLISNAIKYMGTDNADPTIILRAYHQQNKIRFEVQDNGIGISQEDQARLFTSFSRLNKVDTEGLGLGLVIVLRIVTQLQGQVGVESEVGMGSTFWFTLPAAEGEAGTAY
ncbi:MAG: hybrid sensor histidine kinase/response regulator [bacterium]|nr:hybrid sensor histidine kinase/response regulator [bacterium]